MNTKIEAHEGYIFSTLIQKCCGLSKLDNIQLRKKDIENILDAGV